ncbi:conserved hypothetical protein (plasmid) [Acidithiobacillus caldus SM-1]|uniref:Uncharacterized protein n=1 Tax=Acidithiobacillus caldus (strain SM-1) TaxID=990288 RepID=F9ZU86_ACICS|nr:conserved hypothetical protein [Acidithiobacillus caldus SM-1]
MIRSTRSLAGLKRMVCLAAMVISAPVAGLRPLRAGRSCTANVPTPGSVILPELGSADSSVDRNAPKARSASALVIFDCSAIAAINSDLFIGSSKISFGPQRMDWGKTFVNKRQQVFGAKTDLKAHEEPKNRKSTPFGMVKWRRSQTSKRSLQNAENAFSVPTLRNGRAGRGRARRGRSFAGSDADSRTHGAGANRLCNRGKACLGRGIWG